MVRLWLVLTYDGRRMLIIFSEENLNKAQTVFNDRTADEERQKTKSKDQRRRSMSIAHAYYVHSLLAAAEGQWMKALHLGRMSVKSYQRSWAVLERSKGRENDHTGKDPIVHDEIVEAISELSITEHQPAETKKQAHKGTFGAAFWSVAPRLIRGLVHLGHMFARHGLLPEVKYYLGQAREIAHTVKATSFMGQHSSLLGQYLICSGNLQEGLSNLENAEMTLSSIPPDRHYAQLQLSMANAYVDHGIGRNGLSAFDIAEHTLRTLMMKTVLADLTHQPSASEELDLQLRDLSLQEKKPMRKPQTKAQQAKPIKKATKASAQQEATQCIPEEIPASEAIVLSRFKSDIQRGRIQAAFNEGNLGSANTLLDEAVSLPCDQQGSVLQALLASRIRLRQGIEQLVSNPVFCVLQESTIAYPSTKAGSERLQHKKSPCRQQNAARAAPARTQRAKPLATRPRARSPQCSFETNLLDLAQTSLDGVFKLALARSTTSTMHEVTKVLGKILIILSATSSCASNYPVSSIFMAYVLGMSTLNTVDNP